MYYRVIIILFSLLFLMAGVSKVQEIENEVWYFAWKPETGEVIAYTANGDVNTLLEGIEQAGQGWRLDTQTILWVAYINGQINFYKLSPNFAQPIAINFDFDELPDPSPYAYPTIRFVDRSGDYVFLSATASLYQSGLLVDTHNNTIELLEGHIAGSRFSREGDVLRYISGASRDSYTWYFREMTLNTGENKTLYTINDSRLHGLTPDLYGERWLWYTAEDRNATHAHVILHDDGQLEPLGEPLPEGYLDQRRFIGDDLVVSDWYCEADCSIRIYSHDDTLVEFSLPAPMVGRDLVAVDILRRLGRDRLLVVNSPHDYWLLRSNGKAEFLGVSGKLAGQWLLVWDNYENPRQYRVWDSVSENFILTKPSTNFNQVYISDSGSEAFILTEATSPSASDVISITLYQLNGKHFELPLGGYGGYFEYLTDGTLLYQKELAPVLNEKRKKTGIYRYDPNAKIFVLLVQDAEHIELDDVTEHDN